MMSVIVASVMLYSTFGSIDCLVGRWSLVMIRSGGWDHGGNCVAISAPGMFGDSLRWERHIDVSHVSLGLTFRGRGYCSSSATCSCSGVVLIYHNLVDHIGLKNFHTIGYW